MRTQGHTQAPDRTSSARPDTRRARRRATVQPASAAPRRSEAQLRAELESKLAAKASALGLAREELPELEGLG
ncbi:MAG TPA: hypothetical protein PKU97_20615, partial [Kofleriaceae bacterium]|nr:hypothetical protein [Kofleriaceae bacterium]